MTGKRLGCVSWRLRRRGLGVSPAYSAKRRRSTMILARRRAASEEELRTELAREAEAIRLAMELGEQEASRGNEE